MHDQKTMRKAAKYASSVWKQWEGNLRFIDLINYFAANPDKIEAPKQQDSIALRRTALRYYYDVQKMPFSKVDRVEDIVSAYMLSDAYSMGCRLQQLMV